MSALDQVSVDQLPIASGRAIVAELRRSLSGLWPMVAGAAVLLTGAAGAGLVLPFALGSIVDAVEAGRPASSIVPSAVAIVVGTVVAAVLGGLGNTASTRVFDRVVARLRVRLVERALMLPQGDVERAGTGDLVARAGNDVATVANGLSAVLPTVTATGFGFAVTLAGMAVLDWRLLVVLLVIYLPLNVAALRYFLRTAPPVWAEAAALVSTRSNRVLATFRGIDTVTAYGLADRQAQQISEVTWPVVQYGMLTRLIYARMGTRMRVAEVLSLAALLVVAFWLVREGYSSVGTATASVLLLYRLFEPAAQAMSVSNELQAATTSLARVVGAIQAGGPLKPLQTGTVQADEPQSVRQPLGVDVLGVSYAYVPGHPVLHHVDLAVAPGQHVATVGTSGAGKTTLAALIAGSLTPSDGHVRIGDRDVVEMDRQARAAAVAMVSQTTHVFEGTLRDDLTLARPEASDDQVLAALDLVGADWVRGLPDGLDTLVGHTARSLTPAREQQLALARLVLKDPAVAILDEATAEAGSSGARQLERAAMAAVAGRTALVVAHRLSQAALCDRVVVMEAGRIVEDGSHDELVASGGTYGRLWSAWTVARD